MYYPLSPFICNEPLIKRVTLMGRELDAKQLLKVLYPIRDLVVIQRFNHRSSLRQT